MNPQMNLLYLKATGHVLAAFTRNGEPATAETAPDAFLGDGLHVRGLGDSLNYGTVDDFNLQDFVIPASQIGLFRTDLNPTVLASPRRSFITDPDKPSTVKQITAAALLYFNSAGTTAITTWPQPGPFEVQLPNPVTQPYNALVLVSGPVAGKMLVYPPITITSAQPSIAIPLSSLSSGSYHALIFVVGYPPASVAFSIP